MESRRRTRRLALERNLKRLRSSGRVPAVPRDGRVETLSPPSSGRDLGNDPFLVLSPPPGEDAEVETLRAEIAALRRLQEAIHFLGSTSDGQEVRSRILELAVTVSGLPRGMLALPDEDGQLKVAQGRGYGRADRPEVKVLRRILQDAARSGEPLIEGAIAEGGILGHAQDAPRLGAVAALPLAVEGEVLGAILLDDPARDRPFSTGEESLLRSFARHAALALQRLARRRRLKKKAAALQRRVDRLEGTSGHVAAREEEVRSATTRLREASKRLRAAEAEAGLDAGTSMWDGPYVEAKAAFTRRYLCRALRDAHGDLRAVASVTDLPLPRLIALLDTLEIHL